MWPAFCRPPRCGRPARGRCRQSRGPAADGHRRGLRRDAKHQPISVKELALGLPSAPGARSNGAKGTANRLVVALCRACAFVPRTATDELRRSHAARMAADRVAGRRGRADQILALDAAERHLRSINWSTLPSCAGASSVTIRNSSRRSGFGISKGAAGAASTTTPRCASQPTAS